MMSKRKKVLLVLTIISLIGIALAIDLYKKQTPKPTRPALSSEKQKSLRQSMNTIRINYYKLSGYRLLEEKKIQEALPYLREAARLDPEDKRLQQTLQKLEQIAQPTSK